MYFTWLTQIYYLTSDHSVCKAAQKIFLFFAASCPWTVFYECVSFITIWPIVLPKCCQTISGQNTFFLFATRSCLKKWKLDSALSFVWDSSIQAFIHTFLWTVFYDCVSFITIWPIVLPKCCQTVSGQNTVFLFGLRSCLKKWKFDSALHFTCDSFIHSFISF